MKGKKLIYIASPLFSNSEREFNIKIKDMLSQYFDVFLPQEDGELLDLLIKKGISVYEGKQRIFKKDIEALNKCDLLLIIMDGRTIDEGAAFELGYAYAKGKKCIGLQTDIRKLLPYGNNPMIDLPLENTFESTDELLKWIRITGKEVEVTALINNPIVSSFLNGD